jgi:DNA polymerase III delta' subunit
LIAPQPPYAWQQPAWNQLLQAARGNRLHHANLLAGPAGIGKRDFANHFALALVCDQFPDAAPCGKCKNCQMAVGGTHPDIYQLDWLEKSTVIGVDQIRQLIDQLGLTASRGNYRVAVINRAHSMTTAAANSLLKTLEEPGDGCIILLLADRDQELPVTIRSRCQRLAIVLPERDQAQAWLQEQGVAEASVALDVANGAPLLAKAISEAENLAEIAALRHAWDEFLIREGSPDALAATTASLLGTRQSLGLFMQWTTETVKNLELSPANGRSPEQDNPDLRRYLCQVALALQSALRLDNASLKTQAVLEGVLADIRIIRYKNRAENAS